MIQKIKNAIKATCEDVNLQRCKNIEFYVRQGYTTRQYTPNVMSPSEMLVEIPYEDAMQWGTGTARLQFAFTDADGNSRVSDIVTVSVGELLKEAGYDPV